MQLFKGPLEKPEVVNTAKPMAELRRTIFVYFEQLVE
jgi:hypothetical protein